MLEKSFLAGGHENVVKSFAFYRQEKSLLISIIAVEFKSL